MVNSWRTSGLFAAGCIAGGAAVLAAYLGWFKPQLPGAAPARTVASAQQPAVASAQPIVAAATQPGIDTGSCPAQPITQAKDPQDGQFLVQAALASAAPTDPGAFITVAREAAQQGRVRDAEVALMAACRAALQASGAQSAPLADVKSQMGQHYVQLAAGEGEDPVRDSLLQRASTLFAESAEAYAAALGKNASKTRMAQQRLASLREPVTLRAAARQQPGSRTATMGAARASAADAMPPPAMGARASALVQADPELAQLENDLQRLRVQARHVTRDPAGMGRRDAQALALREARCHDKACLRQWYAQRRRQLLAEF